MIDYKFIAELEGTSNIGYVPEPDGGEIESGVTVASGFDIGQRNEYDLIGLPDHIVSLLSPYCGLTGYNAIQKLNELPLIVTDDQLLIINEFAYSEAEDKLIKLWQEWSDTDWNDLTSVQQTVVASVAFQYGYLPTRTPNFWRQVTTGKWREALENLRDFGDNFPTRRNKEADYLMRCV